MKACRSIRTLNKRIDKYLWESDNRKADSFRIFYHKHLCCFSRTAIVGGLIRDFAFDDHKKGFKSDIDIVIEEDDSTVTEFAKILGARKNKYGGFSIKTGHAKIDFWSLESTWTVKNAGVKVNRIDDITRATFFNLDSVLYLIEDRKIICDDTYLEHINNKNIDIVVDKTPSISGNLNRAIDRIFKWNLSVAPRLQDFIIENIEYSTADRAVKKYRISRFLGDNFCMNSFLEYLLFEPKNGYYSDFFENEP